MSAHATPTKDTHAAKDTAPPTSETDILEAEIKLNIETMKGLLDTIHGANLNAGDEENAVLEAIRRAKDREDAKGPQPTPLPTPEPKEPEATPKK